MDLYEPLLAGRGRRVASFPLFLCGLPLAQASMEELLGIPRKSEAAEI